MKVITPRLLLRPIAENDLTDMHAYCAQDGVGEMAGWRHHKTLEETRENLMRRLAFPGSYAIVLRETGKMIGHFSVYPDSENQRGDVRELGYVLNALYHGQGLMTEAMLSMQAYLFDIGVNCLYAGCFTENTASRRVLEKCGFHYYHTNKLYFKHLKCTKETYEYRLDREEWGKTHPYKMPELPAPGWPEQVVIGTDAFSALPEMLTGYGHILLAVEENLLFSGRQLAEKMKPGQVEDTVVCRDADVQHLLCHVTEKTDLLLGIGAGRMQAVCKYAAYLRGIDAAVAASAPSTTGFASARAVLPQNGKMTVFQCRPPRFLVADTTIMAAAPRELLCAGFLDAVSKYSAVNDWCYSALMAGKECNETVLNAALWAVRQGEGLAEKLMERDEGAVARLMEALVLLGRAETQASKFGMSSEEQLALLYPPVLPFGMITAFAAVQTANMRHRLSGLKTPVLYHHEEKLPLYQQKWTKIRALWHDCPSPDVFRFAMHRVGIQEKDLQNTIGEINIMEICRLTKGADTVLAPWHDMNR